ncbi:MAG: LysM peptidoglycan-binding domain-containing protein [Galactobacter sp.]
MTQIALAPHTVTTAALHLTRRGRNLLVRLPLVAAGVAAAFGIGTVLTQPAEAGTPDGGVTTVTVMQGDNLWEIARSVAPERATGDVVEEIHQLNDFTGPLQAGQHIVVPSSH